jgi:hypothetical protein
MDYTNEELGGLNPTKGGANRSAWRGVFFIVLFVIIIGIVATLFIMAK